MQSVETNSKLLQSQGMHYSGNADAQCSRETPAVTEIVTGTTDKFWQWLITTYSQGQLLGGSPRIILQLV
jgi:hypothetical protein